MKKSHLYTIYTIVFVVIGVVTQNFQASFVFSQEKIHSGEIWRIWSGHFVHINYLHLLMNSLGFSILVILYKNLISTAQLIIQIVYLASSIGLSLYFFSPDIQHYAGFSGILYGLFIIAALQALSKKNNLLSYPILFAITGKIIWNKFADAEDNLINMPIATDAHIYGYISAILFMLATTLKTKMTHKKHQ